MRGIRQYLACPCIADNRKSDGPKLDSICLSVGLRAPQCGDRAMKTMLSSDEFDRFNQTVENLGQYQWHAINSPPEFMADKKRYWLAAMSLESILENERVSVKEILANQKCKA